MTDDHDSTQLKHALEAFHRPPARVKPLKIRDLRPRHDSMACRTDKESQQ
jgi:hypothetical protein